jgi:hypothetical protein
MKARFKKFLQDNMFSHFWIEEAKALLMDTTCFVSLRKSNLLAFVVFPIKIKQHVG